MKKISLITIGKLKEKALLELETNYLKRLKSKIEIFELKSFDDQCDQEAKHVLTKISDLEKNTKAYVITLEEKGREFNSPEFSQWLTKKKESHHNIIFILGGAAGHGQDVLKRSNESLSLSKLTFPHQFARVVLIEQLYRAETIELGHPYHK